MDWWDFQWEVEDADEQSLRRRVAEHPDDVGARFRLAQLLLRSGNVHLAIECFQKTRPFQGYTVKAYNGMALAFYSIAGRNSRVLAMK